MPSPADLVFDPSGDALLVLSRRKDAATESPSQGTEQSDNEDDSEVKDSAGEPHSKEVKTIGEIEEVEVKVSSRHLALASPVFRVMFDGHFHEGVVPEGHQLRRVLLPDDDVDAMMVLLNIVHGLSRRLPHKIDLPLLIDIATIAEKYALHEVAEVYTDIWFHELYRSRAKETPESQLPELIFLCWVLRKAAEFESVTRKAIFRCGSRFEDHGLPFSIPVASKIELARHAAIQKILEYLESLIDRYQGNQQQCERHEACDATVLGGLIKSMKAHGLYPLPEPATLDLPISRLIMKSLALRFTSLCHARPLALPPLTSDASSSETYADPECLTSKRLGASIASLKTAITGLDLAEFPCANARPAHHPETLRWAHDLRCNRRSAGDLHFSLFD